MYRRKIKSINDFSPDGLHNFVLSAEFPIPSRSVAVLCPVRLMSSIAIEQNGNAELIAETRLGLGREIRGNFALLSESRRFNQRHLFSPPPQQTAVENRWRSEREREIRSRDISRKIGVYRTSPHSLQAQLERPLRPATATGLFNFVHKSVMEEPLQALPIRNEACRVTMLGDKGFLSLRWPCRAEKLWTFACWSALCTLSSSMSFCLSSSISLSLSHCILWGYVFSFVLFFFLFFAFCMYTIFVKLDLNCSKLNRRFFLLYTYIYI